MCIETGQISLNIRVSFVLFFALVANSADGISFVITFISAFFHELVHLFFLFRFGCRNAVIDFCPGGIKIKAEGFSMLSYSKTVICSLSAPVMNILAGALFFLLWKIRETDIYYIVFVVNAVMGAGNLLPLAFLDGGRALNSFLLKYIKEEKAVKICDFISVVTLLMMIGAFFMLLKTGKNYIFLLFFFFYCTLGCFSEKRDASVT